MRFCLITWLLVIACNVLIYLVSPVQNSVLFILSCPDSLHLCFFSCCIQQHASCGGFGKSHTMLHNGPLRWWLRYHDHRKVILFATPGTLTCGRLPTVTTRLKIPSGHPPFSTWRLSACQNFKSSSAKQADQNVWHPIFHPLPFKIPPRQKSSKILQQLHQLPASGWEVWWKKWGQLWTTFSGRLCEDNEDAFGGSPPATDERHHWWPCLEDLTRCRNAHHEGILLPSKLSDAKAQGKPWSSQPDTSSKIGIRWQNHI